MNKRPFFCHQLAAWLVTEDWHFTTLLSLCIETIDELPADIDALINQLLLAFPQKPATASLTHFLQHSARLHVWFQFAVQPPQIRRFYHLAEEQSFSIADGLPNIGTVGALAKWLDVTVTQLEWLVDLKRYERKTQAHFLHYHYSLVDKRDGSKRLIESPKTLLKSAQRQINSEILSQLPAHPAAYGFRKGMSCQQHAANHTNKTYLFLFDLSHCFHSIHWGQVSRVFKEQGYPVSVVRYLTALCTHRCYPDHPVLSALDSEQCLLLNERHLAQGAPTSPALSNAVLFKLDRRLDGLAKSLGLAYSRYADDIAMSGNQHRDWSFLEPLVGSICREQGFNINYRKTRMIRSHQRQKLTGIVVNQKLNIDRREFDRLKAVLTNCVRHGLASQNLDGHEDFRAHLWGSIQYVKSLNEVKGRKLEQIFRRIKLS